MQRRRVRSLNNRMCNIQLNLTYPSTADADGACELGEVLRRIATKLQVGRGNDTMEDEWQTVLNGIDHDIKFIINGRIYYELDDADSAD